MSTHSTSPTAGTQDATMQRPPLVVLNADAGNGGVEDLGARVEALFERHGRHAEVRSVDGDAIQEVLSRARSGPARQIIAAGGDGTVRTVAEAVLGTDHTLAVLPLGTMNVFARTLSIPLELEDAVEVAVRGVDCPLDVCTANGQLVMNNVSAGLYAEMSLARERRRPRHAHWPTALRWPYDTAFACFDVTRHWNRWRFVIACDGERIRLRSPFFLVSNNDYESLGRMHRRNDGALTLLLPRTTTPLSTLWAATKSAFLGPHHTSDLDVRRVRRVQILGGGTVRVAIDGEVERMALPIDIVPVPHALTVRIPAEVSL